MQTCLTANTGNDIDISNVLQAINCQEKKDDITNENIPLLHTR